MLDIKWILNNPIEADKAFKKRGLKPLSTKLIKMSKSRSEIFVKLENLLKQRNLFSKEIPNTKDESKKKELIKKVKILKDDINKLTQLISSSGGFVYAKQKIDEFSNHAQEAISEYPDSVYKQSLIDLVVFNSKRNY